MTVYPTRMGRAAGMSSTQEQAAHALAPRLSSLLGGYVDPYTLHLFPARGRWAQGTADVQRWTGHFPRPDLPKLTYSIGSWNLTLSKIASGCRFEIVDNRGERKSYGDFAVEIP